MRFNIVNGSFYGIMVFWLVWVIVYKYDNVLKYWRYSSEYGRKSFCYCEVYYLVEYFIRKGKILNSGFFYKLNK